MPQSHPTTGPVRFLSPVRFLARKAEWNAHRNLTSVLFPWSHQAMGPVRLDTAVYLWFGWIIRRTTGIARAPHGNLQCFSYPTGAVRGPCVTRKGAIRRPYGHVRELTQPELTKIPCGPPEWTYDFFFKTAREQPVRDPGVRCDWGIIWDYKSFLGSYKGLCNHIQLDHWSCLM